MLNRICFTIKSLKYQLLWLSLIAIHSRVLGQVPVITSISPLSGAKGTTVSISGNNFSPIAIANTVYFGAAKATVLTANATTITVKVPNGATLQAISVTSNGLTAYSPKPFNLTFAAPAFSTNYFNTVFQDYAGNYGVAIKDIDGDGLSDMAAVNSSGSISFYRNTTANTLSFAAPVNKTLNDYSVGIVLDDLNGDGKPDAVVTNFNAHTVSVFKNTSVPGQVSFDSPLIVGVGSGAYNAVIADFDGDGRSDIAVTDENAVPATISILTNTTVPGGPITFSADKQFPSGYFPRGIATADLDGDRKPELVVASQSSGVLVYRNTSTPGNIAFAPYIAFGITGASCESVVSVDLNGDDKPDIAVAANNAPGSIYTFNNTSTPGTISFGAAQTSPTPLNPFSIAAGDINGDGRPDLAVSNQVSNNLSVLINTSSPSGAITFASKVDFPFGNYPRGLAIADMDNNGKPDIIETSNNTSQTFILLSDPGKQTPVITFPPLANKTTNDNAPFDPGASSTNTSTPITYVSSDPAVAQIDANGKLHILAPGTVTITASQPADDDFNAAGSISQPLTIFGVQTINFPLLTAKTTCSLGFQLNATSNNASIPLTYTTSNNSVATVDNMGNIHIVGVGTTDITIKQAGNGLYNAASPVTQKLTVTQPVAPAVIITADSSKVCQGTPIIVNATITGQVATDFNFQWTINGVGTGSNSPTLLLNAVNPTDQLICTATNKTGCLPPGTSNSLTGLNIEAYSSPSITINSSVTGLVCTGQTIIFTATVSGGASPAAYNWQVNGINAGTNSPTFATATLLNDDIVTCEAADIPGNCIISKNAVSAPYKVSIVTASNPPPTLNISIIENGMYEGTYVTMAAHPANAGNIINYQWLVNGKSAGGNDSIFKSNQLHNNDVIVCIVTSDLPCSVPISSNDLKIMLASPATIVIPDTFTPNSDGINDTWLIPSLVSLPNCKVNVYDRYGRLVFHSTGYQNSWDGTRKGALLPFGVYYYVINIAGREPLSGHVTIIR
ncbi:FG-GAP-like repeat-containing protein [Mucilaginibacter ximonensis]|uniref:FG-GAP-like repeat-containing protein n=1 Tax=Mucilaginibacter ximonensis TaxID=538021 RepID=A0ABW5YHE3_9SPHI